MKMASKCDSFEDCFLVRSEIALNPHFAEVLVEKELYPLS